MKPNVAKTPEHATCDCGWEGKRLWPSPVKPCPHCGSVKIAREIRGPHGFFRAVGWED